MFATSDLKWWYVIVVAMEEGKNTGIRSLLYHWALVTLTITIIILIVTMVMITVITLMLL